MNLAEDISYGEGALSYAEDTTYEEQVAALPVLEDSTLAGLKNRISNHKVYLPPASMTKGKVRNPYE